MRAKQVGTMSYVECSSTSSEWSSDRSVSDVFHAAPVTSLGHGHRYLSCADSHRDYSEYIYSAGRMARRGEWE